MLLHKCEVKDCPTTYPAPPGTGAYIDTTALPDGWYHAHPAPPAIDGIPVRSPGGLGFSPAAPRLVCPKHNLPPYDGTRGLTIHCGALGCDAKAATGHIDALPPGWTLIVQGLEEVIPEANSIGYTSRGAPGLLRPKMRKMLYLALCPDHPQPEFEPLPEPEPYPQLGGGCFPGLHHHHHDPV